MMGSRLVSLLLAALLMLQSAVGLALHRCDSHRADQPPAASVAADNTAHHCQHTTPSPGDGHSAAAQLPDDTPHDNGHQGNCTCAIAHCAPGISSHFDFALTPLPASQPPLYDVIAQTIARDNLLRPPITAC